VEKLNEEIGSIREDIEKYQASAAREENERKIVVQRLEQELSDARKEVSLCDENFQKITQTFESLQSGLTKMIDRLEAMSVTSGTQATKYVKQQEVDAADDKTYLLKDLGWIEHRANELIMANFLHSLPRRSAEEKESVTTIALTFGGITMQGAVQPLMNYSIQAPATGYVFLSTNNFTKPLLSIFMNYSIQAPATNFSLEMTLIQMMRVMKTLTGQ
jgi:hypothetical protein